MGSKRVQWGKGIFSNELISLKLKDIEDQVVGKVVLCEDDKFRTVHEICPSMKYPWFYIINEKDPESEAGHFVSLLTITCLLTGEPPPTKDQREAFRVAARVKFGIEEDGSFDRIPQFTHRKSPIIIPGRD